MPASGIHQACLLGPGQNHLHHPFGLGALEAAALLTMASIRKKPLQMPKKTSLLCLQDVNPIWFTRTACPHGGIGYGKLS
jgi:hypothetical protein